MKVLTVIGNRPQFVKAAAVSRLLRERHDELLVHTGQHYDDELSTVFFEELGVPRPERELRIHGGTNTEQTARMLAALEPLLADERPDVVLVYGDTNSTLAGGLAAAQAGVPVAHVEAGMRSFDRAMPEELNRVLTDHLSDLLLCSVADRGRQPRARARRRPRRARRRRDGRRGACCSSRARARTTQPLRDAGVRRGEYVLATAHRAGNVDDPARLRAAGRPAARARRSPVVLPLHPRTRRPPRRRRAGSTSCRPPSTSVLTPPLGYLAFTALLTSARAVLTDSGGVQKEAYLAGVPCVTLRDTTEWVETVEAGWNVLVDLDLRRGAGRAGRAAAGRPPAALRRRPRGRARRRRARRLLRLSRAAGR